MSVRLHHAGDELMRGSTRRLLERVLSPLCGLDTDITLFSRGAREPRLTIAGASLTGVHHVLGRPAPERSYHIGGAGCFPDEAFIRALGESVERYAQLTAGPGWDGRIRRASWDALAAEGEALLAPRDLRFFTDEQHARPGFPFQPFTRGAELAWVRTRSLVSGADAWIPAQLLLLGYNVQAGEPWLMPAVTTGTAAHTRPAAALRGALLELVQLDSVLGHWYGAGTAPEIRLDGRTRALERLMRRHLDPRGPEPRFYWLANADLPGMTVACVYRDPGRVPAIAVGLGADLSLEGAMYRALLEGAGVLQLAKLVLVQETRLRGRASLEVDTARIFDLDSNVAWYALPTHAGRVDARFDGAPVAARELPPDLQGDEAVGVRHLVDGFRETGKELVLLDLSAADVRALGFRVARAWSPHTLGLSLPSAPALAHPRYAAYGGVRHEEPHPYP